MSEWRNSGHPVGSPVSEALVCGQGPHSVLRGRVCTVLVQKSESEVLVRMLWASGVRPCHSAKRGVYSQVCGDTCVWDQYSRIDVCLLHGGESPRCERRWR